MIVGVFGIPSATTNWGAQIVRALLAELFGSCELITARTVEDAARCLYGRKMASGIIFNQYPDPLLLRLLVEEKVPILLFCNSFEATVRELMMTSTLSLSDAVRTATICFSAIEEAMTRAPMIIRSDIRKNPISELLAAIAGFLNVRVTKEQFYKSSVTIAAEGGVRKVYNLEELDAPSDTHRSVTQGFEQNSLPNALTTLYSSYDTVLDGQIMRRVVWPASVFLDADHNATPADRELELTGPAQFLIYGPYFGLPCGNWLAQPAFQLHENFTGNRLTIDVVGSGEVLAIGRCDLPASRRL